MTADAFHHRRRLKRYGAALVRHGLCRMCVHRERTGEAWHCRNAPQKQQGACMEGDGSYPKFKVVENILDEFSDAT